MHVLQRALRLNKLHERAVKPSKLADQRSPALSTSMKATTGTP